MSLWYSFGTVFVLLAITAPTALLFGFGGATAARSRILPLSWFGRGYIAIVRGVPDIAFFLFFVILILTRLYKWLISFHSKNNTFYLRRPKRI